MTQEKVTSNVWIKLQLQEDKEAGWRSVESAKQIAAGVIHRVSTRQINKAASGMPDMINNSVSESTLFIPGAKLVKVTEAGSTKTVII